MKLQDASYMAALDPWLHRSVGATNQIIKECSLTSRHLVLSDNQLLNNSALHHLFQRSDFSEFLFSPDSDGYLPVVISLRDTARTFEEVLLDLIARREHPAIMPWLSNSQQAKLEQAYAGGAQDSLGPLYDISGRGFTQYVDVINRFIVERKSSVVTWKGLQKGYHEQVYAALNGLVNAIDSGICVREQDSVLRACEMMMEGISSGVAQNRSNLYRVLESCQLTKSAKRALALRVLHQPYHANFAASGQFNIVTGNEYFLAPASDIFGPLSSRIEQQAVRTEVTEIEALPISLTQIPYSSILEIRHSRSFPLLIDAVHNSTEEDRPKIIRELFGLIRGHLPEGQSKARRLMKMRIASVPTPVNIESALNESGLSFADVISLMAKTTGFATAEAIGWSVGVIGLGGIIGATGGTIVERLIDNATLKRQRRKEYQQLVQILTKQSPSTNQ
jgi:hypothetical protein